MFVTFLCLFYPFSHLSDFLLRSGRNDDYQNLNLTYATQVMKSSVVLGVFPKPLKP